ncbi:MAG: hypothetical protein ABIP65_11425, partial [Vicinamibacterales bacterium]
MHVRLVRMLGSAIGVAVVLTGSACRKAAEPRREDNQQAQQTSGPGGYPAPRWPSYFQTPKSPEDLMPAARALVRNTSGFQGKGMGILQAGEAVLIVPTASTDPMVLDAIKRALTERRITVHIKYTYEFLGETQAQAKAGQTGERKGRDITNAGIYQASSWITGQFPDPAVPKKWLKERRPDLYAELFPAESQPASGAAPAGQAAGNEDPETGLARSNPREREIVGNGIKDFLKSHPEVKGAFWGSGGSTGLRRALY